MSGLLDRFALDAVLQEVYAERERQHEKWGEQNHPDGTGGEPSPKRSPEQVAQLRSVRVEHARNTRDLCDHAFAGGTGTWRHILREEVDEAIAEDDPVALRKELIQVAAVAVSWVEAIDRRAKR